VKLIVADITIMTGLLDQGFLGKLIELGHNFQAADFTFSMVGEPRRQALVSHGLAELELSPRQVICMTSMFRSNPGLCTSEAAALTLAGQGGSILGGSATLRRIASIQHCDVHGIDWIAQELAGVFALPVIQEAFARCGWCSFPDLADQPQEFAPL